mgnify:CR=1 FL=1
MWRKNNESKILKASINQCHIENGNHFFVKTIGSIKIIKPENAGSINFWT